MTRARSTRLALVLIAALSALSCDPDSLKDIIEDKFPDFTGLETALKRAYIVGLQPDPGFPNLHCCWGGEPTAWEKIAGSWSTEGRTAVNAGIAGIVSSIGFEISAETTSYVEAKAEPFYRQQLLNIRHFARPHCPAHDGSCAKTICSDSLKVGTVSVTSYVEWKGGAGVSAGKTAKVSIGNKEYTKDTMTANDIIVGYKMEEVRCGPAGVSFGAKKSPSAEPKKGETYDTHVRLRQWLTGQIDPNTGLPLRPASTEGNVILPRSSAAGLIAPPPAGVIAGQVIRVSTTGEDGRPTQTLSGIVVAETDGEGRTETREVRTDGDGAAWIPVAATTALLTIRQSGREVLRVEPGPTVPLPERPPAIGDIGPYLGEAPEGIVPSGSLVEVTGSDFGVISGGRVNGEPVELVATGGDWAVIGFDAVGPATIELESFAGLASPPVTVEGVSILVEQAPPPTLTAGQSAAVVLRLGGSERALPIRFRVDTAAVTLPGGAGAATVASAGGTDNIVRTSVTAVRSGAYTINFSLAGDAGE